MTLENVLRIIKLDEDYVCVVEKSFGGASEGVLTLTQLESSFTFKTVRGESSSQIFTFIFTQIEIELEIMDIPLIECVPNFSEGRDTKVRSNR